MQRRKVSLTIQNVCHCLPVKLRAISYVLAVFRALHRMSYPIRIRRPVPNRMVQIFPSPIQILRRSIRSQGPFQ